MSARTVAISPLRIASKSFCVVSPASGKAAAKAASVQATSSSFIAACCQLGVVRASSILLISHFPELCRCRACMFTEKSAERTQTLEPARTTHIRYGHLCRSQKVGGPFHPAPGEIAMRSFAKQTGEAAVEVIRRKGGLSGDLMEVERL